jgi:TonB family protein
MDMSKTKRLAQKSFLLSLLLHLLFSLGVVTVITNELPEKKKNTPAPSVPSYVYKSTHTPPYVPKYTQSTPNVKQAHKNTTSPTQTQQTEKSQPTSRYGLKHAKQKSIMEMTRDVIRQDQVTQTMTNLENIEPMLMIGDHSSAPDPFLQALGHSLSANLNYPKMEGELGGRGRVLVAMVLHPEGNFTNVQIVRSSENSNFDAAALYAVNKAPPVAGANRFLSKPKYFVVGFIFE